MLGLIDDDDLARVHFVVDAPADEKFGMGRGFQPRGTHPLQPVLTAWQRLDFCPSRGCELGLSVVPVEDLGSAVGMHADFLGNTHETEILMGQLVVRDRLDQEVMRVEDLPRRGVRRRLFGTFGPEELPFSTVDDGVDLVDQHMPWGFDTGIGQVPDCFAGRDHDRRPSLRDRPETVLLVRSEHVDLEVGQQFPIGLGFTMGQRIGRGHEQNIAVLHRTLYRSGHEYQRFALSGLHFRRT
nr:hypothetical protein [Nocardia cyriacigeorgica]